MKLKHAKGIHDFNRALAINPTLFQVSVTTYLVFWVFVYSKFVIDVKWSNSYLFIQYLKAKRLHTRKKEWFVRASSRTKLCSAKSV